MRDRSNADTLHAVARTVLPSVLALLALMTASCMTGTRLATDPAVPADAVGTYTAYLYGCTYSNDLETMALLVDESAPYRVRLMALPTSYRTQPGLTGEAALAEARAFIRCGIYSTGASVLRRVSAPSGAPIAFELKPLYSPLDMGTDEVVLSHYVLDGNEVRVYFRLDPAVERGRDFDRGPLERD